MTNEKLEGAAFAFTLDGKEIRQVDKFSSHTYDIVIITRNAESFHKSTIARSVNDFQLIEVMTKIEDYKDILINNGGGKLNNSWRVNVNLGDDAIIPERVFVDLDSMRSFKLAVVDNGVKEHFNSALIDANMKDILHRSTLHGNNKLINDNVIRNECFCDKNKENNIDAKRLVDMMFKQ